MKDFSELRTEDDILECFAERYGVEFMIKIRDYADNWAKSKSFSEYPCEDAKNLLRGILIGLEGFENLQKIIDQKQL